MRRPELDNILTTMLESRPEVSDLLFTVDKPLQVESFGELKSVDFDPQLIKLTPYQTEMIEINRTKAVHIITLEDPVEFVHPHMMATFNQREQGTDFDSFSNGLRAALRQAPKVILVGEMRDRDTVKIALCAAETGHLVLSTLHTIDAGQSINRMLGMFELAEETQMRLRLADTIRYVISQRLAPKRGGGR